VLALGRALLEGEFLRSGGQFRDPDRGYCAIMQREGDTAATGRSVVCDMCELRQAVSDANAAISTVQMIEDAVVAIRGDIGLMLELAEKAVKRYCTCAEKAAMQEELKRLAQCVNETVDTTEKVSPDGSEHNKLLSADGHTIDQPIGKGRMLHIVSTDLSFPADGIDLASDGKKALTTIMDVRARANEYADYLDGEASFLVEIISEMEQRAAASQDVGPMDFSVISESTGFIGEMFSEYPELIRDCQANVSPAGAMRVLYG